MDIIRSRPDRDCVLELAMRIPYMQFHADMYVCVSDIHMCFYFPNACYFYTVSRGDALI